MPVPLSPLALLPVLPVRFPEEQTEAVPTASARPPCPNASFDHRNCEQSVDGARGCPRATAGADHYRNGLDHGALLASLAVPGQEENTDEVMVA